MAPVLSRFCAFNQMRQTKTGNVEGALHVDLPIIPPRSGVRLGDFHPRPKETCVGVGNVDATKLPDTVRDRG